LYKELLRVLIVTEAMANWINQSRSAFNFKELVLSNPRKKHKHYKKIKFSGHLGRFDTSDVIARRRV